MISNLNGSDSVRVHRKKAVFTGSRFRFGFGSTPWYKDTLQPRVVARVCVCTRAAGASHARASNACQCHCGNILFALCFAYLCSLVCSVFCLRSLVLFTCYGSTHLFTSYVFNSIFFV